MRRDLQVFTVVCRRPDAMRWAHRQEKHEHAFVGVVLGTMPVETRDRAVVVTTIGER